EPHRVLLAELEQGREVEGGTVLLRKLPAEGGGVLGVGYDFQGPRVAGEPDFASLRLAERVRDRAAAGHVAELRRWGEVGLQFFEGRGEFWRNRLGGAGGNGAARRPRRPAPQEESPAQLRVAHGLLPHGL